MYSFDVRRAAAERARETAASVRRLQLATRIRPAALRVRRLAAATVRAGDQEDEPG